MYCGTTHFEYKVEAVKYDNKTLKFVPFPYPVKNTCSYACIVRTVRYEVRFLFHKIYCE